MARAIWKGSISFGLVQIPVGLFTAEDPKDLSFTMLDKRDLSPVGYERVNKNTGEKVEWDQIVKGYEYEPGEYVVLQKEDFERAYPEATQTIDIVDFVDHDEIAPLFYEKPYFLGPLGKNQKGYALLREALKKTKKVGIARVVIRTRQRLAALIARGPVLILDVLRYPHELRNPLDLELPDENAKKAGLDPREIQMAERLIEGMAGKWDPTKYEDQYFDALMGVIEEKARTGQTEAIAAPDAPERPKAGERDLMTLLKKSLDAAERGDVPHLAPAPFAPRKRKKIGQARTRGTRARAAARGGRWASKRTGRSGTSRARRSPKAK